MKEAVISSVTVSETEQPVRIKTKLFNAAFKASLIWFPASRAHESQENVLIEKIQRHSKKVFGSHLCSFISGRS